MPQPLSLTPLLDAVRGPGPLLRVACAIAFLGMVAWLFYASWKPAVLPNILPPWDKLVHFGYYATLTVLLIVARGGRGFVIAALVVIGVGAADELYQSTVPQRDADWLDFAADAFAAVVAAAAFARIARSRAARTT
jgi:VanZ family protein